MKNLGAAAALIVTMVASASSIAAAEAGDVEIRFEARAGDRVLRCGEPIQSLGRSGASATLQDFRIYVSRVRFIAADASEHDATLTPDDTWQSERVALLDFENATGGCNGNAATNTTLRVRAPAGNFTGIAFDIGVPADLNHQDTTLAAPPLNLSALTWPWRYGYKFTTIDLGTSRVQVTAKPMHGASGFSIHLGSVDCGEGSPSAPPSVPCATPNRPSIRLDGFDVSRQVVVFDLAALLADTDVTVNMPETASGCMSGPTDDDCTAIMDRLGLPFRGKASTGQRFVRVTTPGDRP